MKKIVIFTILLGVNAQASLPDYFGGAASTMGLSGQCNFQASDAANHYHCPALLARAGKNSFSINTFSVRQNFTEIDDVVIRNELNSPDSSTKTGEVDVNQPDQHFLGMHLGLKLFEKSSATLGVSFFTPVDKFLEADSGDAYRPEYVMYKSRYNRMTFFSSVAFNYGENLSYSVGLLGGMQSAGRTSIVASDAGSDEPSSGSVVFNAKPTVAPTASVYYQFNQDTASFLTLQSEMKNNFENIAEGYTPIGASSVKYDWKMSSMLYYDPAMIRLGATHSWKRYQLIGSVEYQLWQNYQTPKLHIKNQGGILISSKDEEEIDMKNILVSKLGFKINLDSSQWLLGIGHRPTPIEKDHSKSGNSLDSDSMTFSLARLAQLQVFEQNFTYSIAAQMQQLSTVHVDKDSGMENGNPGRKIGDGGYDIGGQIFVLSLGLSWVL